MRRGSITAGCMIATIVIALSVLQWAEHPRAATTDPALPIEICAGTPYVVPVSAGIAQFDLDLADDQSYLLLIGSLGRGDREYGVTLAAERIGCVEHQPLIPLPPADPLPCAAESRNVPARFSTQTTASPSREFFIHVTSGALENPLAYRKIAARTIAEGVNVRVYLDADQSPGELAPGLADELVHLFDNEIVPVSRRHCGVHADVDGDGKFAILLTHWLGKLQGGATSVGGFVRGSDFRSDIQAPFGNLADVLYLNSNITPGPALRTLLAHEYAHAVLFSARGGGAEEDWLNEAIAHLAENLHGREWSNLDHRIDAFLECPAHCPLVVPDYYRAGRWRDHGCRGATYLFLRWCADTHGDALLRRLIHSPEMGVRNVERVTGQPFAELFRRWTIALAQPADSTQRPNAGFRYLSLHEPVGDFQLNGVARNHWNITGPAQFSLCGTAVRVMELNAANAPGPFRLSVTADAAARLQLTLINLDETTPNRPQPRHELAAR